jgi:hypothetical protein
VSPKARLSQLESEMKEMRLAVKLELTPSGIKIISGVLLDRLLAAAELRRRHITLYAE